MHNTIAAAPISAASDEVRLKSICHHLHLVLSNPNVGGGGGGRGWALQITQLLYARFLDVTLLSPT